MDRSKLEHGTGHFVCSCLVGQNPIKARQAEHVKISHLSVQTLLVMSSGSGLVLLSLSAFTLSDLFATLMDVCVPKREMRELLKGISLSPFEASTDGSALEKVRLS